MQNLKLLIVLSFLLLNASVYQAKNKTTLFRSAQTKIIKYKLTVQPQMREAFIEGLITDVKAAEVKQWESFIAGLPDIVPSKITDTPEGVRFSYSVRESEKPEIASHEASIDENHLRAWGWNLFTTPVTEQPLNQTELTINAPKDWQVITSLGVGQKRLKMSVDDLRGLALALGDFRAVNFKAAGVPVYVAIREKDPTREATVQALKALVSNSVSYFGTKPSRNVMFAIDLLDGKKSYAPGNNTTSRLHSTTVLLHKDNDDPRRMGFAGTFAHEYTHSWIPHAFGNSNATIKNLGAFFTEGFTNYFGYRLARLSGLHDDATLAKALSYYYVEYAYISGVGRKGNEGALGYSHGMVAACVLDTELLRATSGKSGLKEVMQLLLRRHGNTDGLTKDELIAALTETGGSKFGTLYEQLANDKASLDIPALLQNTGIEVKRIEDAKLTFDTYTGNSASLINFTPNNAGEKQFLSWFLSPER
jgi:predicted metalloprotease with PDZ domain